MKWILQEISDIGTSNPIVARLLVQTCDLLDSSLFNLTKEQTDEIKNILGMNVAKRLTACYKIFLKIEEEIKNINKIKFNERITSNSIFLPSIKDLNHLCESFLYEAKSALRDLTKIFNVFYGKKFNGARFDIVANWAKEEFGESHDLYLISKENHNLWIKKIIDMRNAIEHPESSLGRFIIENVKLIKTDTPPYYKKPKWHIEGDVESSIFNDMNTIINNIMSFSEDILVILLNNVKIKLPNNAPINFVEIPENKRNKDCPVRIKIHISAEDLGLPIE